MELPDYLFGIGLHGYLFGIAGPVLMFGAALLFHSL